jgi:hypothetical protein
MSFTAPNWRDASVYPKADTQPTLSFWAWQFLRRNPAYQADWDSLIKVLRDLLDREPEWLQAIEREPLYSKNAWNACATSSVPAAVLSQSIVMWRLDPPARPDEKRFTAWLSRADGTQKKATPINLALGEKWGLRTIQDPAEDDLRPGNSFTVGGALTLIGSGYKKPDAAAYLTVEFDLRYPVDVLRAQFETVLKLRKELLDSEEVVAYEGRPQKALPRYENYLRVLDALDASEKIAVIAEELLPYQEAEHAKKTVGNWKNAALKIRDETYLLIPATGVTQPVVA